jgi:hypothetical protein
LILRALHCADCCDDQSFLGARDFLKGIRGPVALVPYDGPLDFDNVFGNVTPPSRLDVAPRLR